MTIARSIGSWTKGTALACVALLILSGGPAGANPKGGDVIAGQATITAPDSVTVNIHQSTNKAIINWQSFNIGVGETTQFFQPDASALTLNRVIGSQDPSRILGNLKANGTVVVVNPDGILFGPNAKVDVGGLIATTHDIANDDFMAGRFNFNLSGNPSASIVNLGNISIADHGIGAFVAPGVRNQGVIAARLGKVTLAGANRFSLDLYGDELISLALDDALTSEVIDVASGKSMKDVVRNDGAITGDGTIVALTAATARKVVNSVINNTGVIEANSISTRNGKIILGARTAQSKQPSAPKQAVKVSGRLDVSGKLPGTPGGLILIEGEFIELEGAYLNADGVIKGGRVLIGGDYFGGRGDPDRIAEYGIEIEPFDVANATDVIFDTQTRVSVDATESGPGGKVVVWADNHMVFDGVVTARGGPLDGDGGFVETSGRNTFATAGFVDASARNGDNGTWLVDPAFVDLTALIATIEATLNTGTDFDVVATDMIAHLFAFPDTITKSSGGNAQLTLDAGSGYISLADLSFVSTSGELDLVFRADTGIDIDRSTIRTNGGDVDLRSHGTGGFGPDPIWPGRNRNLFLDLDDVNIVTNGGNVRLQDDVRIVIDDSANPFVFPNDTLIDAGTGTIDVIASDFVVFAHDGPSFPHPRLMAQNVNIKSDIIVSTSFLQDGFFAGRGDEDIFVTGNLNLEGALIALHALGDLTSTLDVTYKVPSFEATTQPVLTFLGVTAQSLFSYLALYDFDVINITNDLATAEIDTRIAYTHGPTTCIAVAPSFCAVTSLLRGDGFHFDATGVTVFQNAFGFAAPQGIDQRNDSVVLNLDAGNKGIISDNASTFIMEGSVNFTQVANLNGDTAFQTSDFVYFGNGVVTINGQVVTTAGTDIPDISQSILDPSVTLNNQGQFSHRFNPDNWNNLIEVVKATFPEIYNRPRQDPDFSDTSFTTGSVDNTQSYNNGQSEIERLQAERERQLALDEAAERKHQAELKRLRAKEKELELAIEDAKAAIRLADKVISDKQREADILQRIANQTTHPLVKIHYLTKLRDLLEEIKRTRDKRDRLEAKLTSLGVRLDDTENAAADARIAERYRKEQLKRKLAEIKEKAEEAQALLDKLKAEEEEKENETQVASLKEDQETDTTEASQEDSSDDSSSSDSGENDESSDEFRISITKDDDLNQNLTDSHANSTLSSRDGFTDITPFKDIPDLNASTASKVRDYASLANEVYSDPPDPILFERASIFEEVLPYTLGTVDLDDGLYAEVYQHKIPKNPNVTEIVVVFRGTEDGIDWHNNIRQISMSAVSSTQYANAKNLIDEINNARTLLERQGKDIHITITGHSLGGGLAQYVSATSSKSIDQLVTFNSAGLGEGTANEITELYPDYNSLVQDVVHVRTEGDPVSLIGLHLDGEIYNVDLRPGSGFVEKAVSETYETLFDKSSLPERHQMSTLYYNISKVSRD